MERRRFLAAVGTAATASLAGCSSVGGQQTGDVQMRAVAFSPAEYTVEVGDEVVWNNPSSRSHTVTAYGSSVPEGAEYFASGGFGSESAARRAYPRGDVPAGGEYRHTFEVEGDYEYFCIPHESVGMVGTIRVRAGGASVEIPEELPGVPDAARSLAVAAGSAMLSVLGLAYVLMKYGGNYGGGDGDGGSGRPRAR